MKNFALIGAAGYIAPRHMEAIKNTGHELVAALDRSDSVGIMDRFFPNTAFFTEFERFDRHIEMLRRKDDTKRVDYVSICSPNYLHDAHIRFALRVHADAICEKPLALNPWNVEAIQEIEQESGKQVNTILQLRLHPEIMELKKRIEAAPTDKKHDIDLTYITSRGKWYMISWKGDVHKSGGIATNIGIHFFDMLIWIFGAVQSNTVHLLTPTRAAGVMELEHARIRWFLSLERDDLPKNVAEQGNPTYRCISIDDREIEFSGGFTDLHIHSYKEILAGNGYRLDDVMPSIQAVYDIRNATPIGLKGEYHPKLKEIPYD